jgi:trimethylamine monooxygenase
MSYSNERVGVIGAGPSGIGLLHAFEMARNRGEIVPQLVCFEKQNEIGGAWTYTWRTGLDEYGEPIHSSMYQNLRLNVPKEAIEYPEYPFIRHFDQKTLSSFPSREIMHEYIKGYAEMNDILQYIQFNTVVKWVTYNSDMKQFDVLIRDLLKDDTRTEQFDYLIVATGHFYMPNIPYFQGIETFPGKVLHAHDFRHAQEFVDKNVLIIGSSYSAEDIGLLCWKAGAKSVTFSYRTKPMGYKWPDGCIEVCLVSRIENSCVHFIDKSYREFDSIIFCTGYKHHFPFLADNLRLRTENRFCLSNLYKGIFWLDEPHLIYLGMQNQVYGLNLYNVQAWYARDIILGKQKLPSIDSMNDDIRKWKAKEAEFKTKVDSGKFQLEYILDLQSLSDYPKFDIIGMAKIFLQWLNTRHENILTFREHTYESVITGTVATNCEK